MTQEPAGQPRTILVIDVGGTHVKVKHGGDDEEREVASGPTMTPAEMVAHVQEVTRSWSFDAITMGYPGPVLHGRIAHAPQDLGPGWQEFDFVEAFGKPLRIVNDAAMQALGIDGHVQPREMGHLLYKKGRTFEDDVGVAARERRGARKWRRAVAKVVAELSAALEPDYVVIGGGNAKTFEELPPNCCLGDDRQSSLLHERNDRTHREGESGRHWLAVAYGLRPTWPSLPCPHRPRRS